MKISVEDLQKQIPSYLTQPQQVGLIKELRRFPDCNFYTSRGPNDALQGDGWTPFEVFSFNTGERKKTRGIILSNSCDISTENVRALPPKLTIAPVIALSSYRQLLAARGVSEERVESMLRQIKAQEVTSVFYLPAGGDLTEEHIVPLDEVHSIPSDYWAKAESRKKLFTLSQVGFYLFLMKLSIHFCRMHEAFDRDAGVDLGANRTT
ncbi:MAG: hypothetical protein ACRYGO_19060 [Janthinobacterium lividum]